MSFFQVTERKDFSRVLEKLRALDSTEVNILDDLNMSPLLYAVRYNHYDAVKLLIENKHAGVYSCVFAPYSVNRLKLFKEDDENVQ